MNTRYGYLEADLNSAKGEMRGILKERAKVRGMITYSDLVKMVNIIPLKPNSYGLAAMLDEISTEEDAAGRGMLSAIVVHKHGDMQPGPGFFKLAKKLGRDTSDILKCWVDEFKRVHAYWSKS